MGPDWVARDYSLSLLPQPQRITSPRLGHRAGAARDAIMPLIRGGGIGIHVRGATATNTMTMTMSSVQSPSLAS